MIHIYPELNIEYIYICSASGLDIKDDSWVIIVYTGLQEINGSYAPYQFFFLEK